MSTPTHDVSRAPVNSTTTAPASVPEVTIPYLNFSRPSTANDPSSAQNHHAKQAPVYTNDRYRKLNSILRSILVLVGLTGIGCASYIFSTLSLWPSSSYNPVVTWELWPSLLTFSISILWCGLCILYFVLRKRPHTIHPGLSVAFDLLLSLGFVISALYVLLALRSMMRYGRNGELIEYVSMEGYTSDSFGNYVLQGNDTWVWQRDTTTLSEDIQNAPRTCQGSGYPNLPSLDGLDYDAALSANAAACATQDAGVNSLWRTKAPRVNVTLAALVCQFIGLIGHFVLFVGACVETHRYRRKKVGRDDEKRAKRIVGGGDEGSAVVIEQGQMLEREGAGLSGEVELVSRYA
ncbi:hypothetical protein T440DRAFT_409201 [Plenodomus tracheiphilus IPT5]|uniref:Uncharacterized protein n=1 Tax=Plenodomus tracheiphilus IPT5 TaxID=1408161 RepID=A0A6A7ARX8_9PLEO|nr:hypothetical protein T440DRAFT_409201 [Plenodomus tracheiphilus IPT5]